MQLFSETECLEGFWSEERPRLSQMGPAKELVVGRRAMSEALPSQGEVVPMAPDPHLPIRTFKNTNSGKNSICINLIRKSASFINLVIN